MPLQPLNAGSRTASPNAISAAQATTVVGDDRSGLMLWLPCNTTIGRRLAPE